MKALMLIWVAILIIGTLMEVIFDLTFVVPILIVLGIIILILCFVK